MNAAGWYGVSFSLIDKVGDILKEADAVNKDGGDSRFLTMRASILLDLATALQDGLERSHTFELANRKDGIGGERKVR